MSDRMNTLLGRVFAVRKPDAKTKFVAKFALAKFLKLADEVREHPERFVSAYEDAITGTQTPQVTMGIFESSRGGLLASLWENRDQETSQDEMPD